MNLFEILVVFFVGEGRDFYFCWVFFFGKGDVSERDLGFVRRGWVEFGFIGYFCGL